MGSTNKTKRNREEMRAEEEGLRVLHVPIPVSTSGVPEIPGKPFNDTFFKADWSTFSTLHQVIPARVINKLTHDSTDFPGSLAIQRVTCYHIQICLLQYCASVDNIGVQ